MGDIMRLSGEAQLRTLDTLIIFFNSNECDTQWVRPEISVRVCLGTGVASSPFLKPFSTAADDEFLVVMNRIVDQPWIYLALCSKILYVLVSMYSVYIVPPLSFDGTLRTLPNEKESPRYNAALWKLSLLFLMFSNNVKSFCIKILLLLYNIFLYKEQVIFFSGPTQHISCSPNTSFYVNEGQDRINKISQVYK